MSKFSTAFLYRTELQIPNDLKGMIIGKQGCNIKRYQKTPGISQVRLLPTGKLIVSGVSKEAVLRIKKAVKLVLFRSSGFFPLFHVYCFCHSLDKPKVPVPSDLLSFEVVFEENGAKFVCFRDGRQNEVKMAESSLVAEFQEKAKLTDMTFSSVWDFSAYRHIFVDCLQKLDLAHEEQLKLIVRFGKHVFHGRKANWLLEEGCSLAQLRNLCNARELSSRFRVSCSQTAVEALKSVLESQLGFVRVSRKKKISIHVLHNTEDFNVSVRFLNKNEKQIGEVLHEEADRILRARDVCEVLEVNKEASEDDIKNAYRRCLLRLNFRNSEGKSSEKAEKILMNASNSLLLSLSGKFPRHIVSSANTLTTSSSEAAPKTMETEELKLVASSPKAILEASDKEEGIVISRIRRHPMRHGFVSFLQSGGTKRTDFRMGVSSFKTSEVLMEHLEQRMKEWIECGWRNRTPDKKLVFPESVSRSNGTDNASCEFEALNIRYKETQTYVTEDFKLRIAYVEEEDPLDLDNNEKVKEKRWECGLSSRWFKWNDSMRCLDDATILETDVVQLVKQATLISNVMDTTITSP